jgi:catechol 2,3-dioxygenase-like lactoylglutathione lyase family enzyme
MQIPTSAAVVRYQVANVERSLNFYNEQLGFVTEKQAGPVAILKRGDLRLLLSGPESSGSRAMPDGRKQDPGGWNRIVLYVEELETKIEALRKTGIRFRNEIERGPGGTQILLDDPDGNPIELHQNGPP